MRKLVNRAKMDISTTGTGTTVSLGSAAAGFQSFADAGLADGDTFPYGIEDGTDWEAGEATYNSTGPTLTLAVSESSNSDARINLTGSAKVFCTPLAVDFIETAADLTHTAGAITLDVQSADLFRFEADTYVVGQTPAVSGTQVFVNSGGNFTMTLPTGLSEGDVVFLVLGTDDLYNLVTPAGWTLLYAGQNGGYPIAVYAIVKSAGALTNPFVSRSSPSFYGGVFAFAFSGLNPSLVLDTSVVWTRETSGSNSLVVNGITTISSNALVLTIPAFLAGTDRTITPPENTTELIEAFSDEVGYNYSINSTVRPSPGPFSPGTYSFDGGVSLSREALVLSVEALAGSGENVYTITFDNIPSSGIASGVIDLELKSDVGSVAFAGGTVSWRGAVPAFDEVGEYLIAFWADASGITLLDLTAAITAGGAMSGAAIVSAINAELGDTTWQGGGGGSTTQYLSGRETGTTSLTSAGYGTIDYDTDSYSSTDFSLASGVITYTGTATVSALINAYVGCGAPDTTRTSVIIRIQTRPSGGSWTTVAEGKGYLRQAADGGGVACSAIVELDEDDEIRVLGTTESGTVSTETGRSGITVNTI